jgi:hypothetical protein
MLDRLDETSDERIKALGEIERDKLRVARAYNKKVRENHFRSEISFRRRFCLSGPNVTSSGSDHQIRNNRIELKKQFLEILICFKVCKESRCQGRLTEST